MNRIMIKINALMLLGIILSMQFEIAIIDVLVMGLISGLVLVLSSKKINLEKSILLIVFIISILHANRQQSIFEGPIEETYICDQFEIIELKNNRCLLKSLKTKDKWVAYLNEEDCLDPGDQILASGTLRNHKVLSNKGLFDKRKYWFARKVKGEFKIKNIEKVLRVRNPWSNLQKDTKKFLEKENKMSRAVIDALVFGQVDYEDESINLFKKMGVGHLIAISGLHLGIIAVALDSVMKKMRLYPFFRYTIISLLLALYIKAIGSPVSAQRAFFMILIYMVSRVIHRRRDLVTLLSFASALILIQSPYFIYDIGYQLSFGAVFCVGYIQPRLFAQCPIELSKTKKCLGTAILTQIQLAPLLVYHFSYLPLCSILANIIIMPIAGILVGASFLTVMGLMISEKLALLPLFIVETLVRIYLILGKLIEKYWFFGIDIGMSHFIYVVIFYMLGLLVLNWRYFFNWQQWVREISLGAILFFLIFSLISTRVLDCRLRINHLDAGQGDACLVQYKGKNYLIDSGGSEYGHYSEGVLYPYLLKNCGAKLDAVIISHFDADHCKGINDIKEKVAINQFLFPQREVKTEYQVELERYAARRGIELLELGNNQKINLDKGLTLKILNPMGNLIQDENNDSLVFLLEHGNFRELFTGDMEEETEERLPALGEVNVVKIPHHGSKTSTTDIFLNKVAFEKAIISVGAYNPYGHPKGEIIDKLKGKNIEIYRTDQQGEITLISKGKSYIIRTYADKISWSIGMDIYLLMIYLFYASMVEFKEVGPCIIRNTLKE